MDCGVKHSTLRQLGYVTRMNEDNFVPRAGWRGRMSGGDLWWGVSKEWMLTGERERADG